LIGRGRFVDYIAAPGQSLGVVLCSPHEHAVIDGIDVTAARTMPGVFTAADLDADGIGTLPCIVQVAAHIVEIELVNNRLVVAPIEPHAAIGNDDAATDHRGRARHDFVVHIAVLSGDSTVTRDNKPEIFRAGDHCTILTGCSHTTNVGPKGVAYIVGKGHRRPSVKLGLIARELGNQTGFPPHGVPCRPVQLRIRHGGRRGDLRMRHVSSE
jgi:hypothetical protein